MNAIIVKIITEIESIKLLDTEKKGFNYINPKIDALLQLLNIILISDNNLLPQQFEIVEVPLEKDEVRVLLRKLELNVQIRKKTIVKHGTRGKCRVYEKLMSYRVEQVEKAQE